MLLVSLFCFFTNLVFTYFLKAQGSNFLWHLHVMDLETCNIFGPFRFLHTQTHVFAHLFLLHIVILRGQIAIFALVLFIYIIILYWSPYMTENNFEPPQTLIILSCSIVCVLSFSNLSWCDFLDNCVFVHIYIVYGCFIVSYVWVIIIVYALVLWTECYFCTVYTWAGDKK